MGQVFTFIFTCGVVEYHVRENVTPEFSKNYHLQMIINLISNTFENLKINLMSS